jgi:hypothetical protein
MCKNAAVLKISSYKRNTREPGISDPGYIRE